MSFLSYFIDTYLRFIYNYLNMKKSLLIKLGLTENASEIYLALIQKGDSTVEEISSFTGIKRTNIYPYINELKSLKLIAWEERKKNSALKVLDIDNLKKFAKKKVQEAQNNKIEIENQIPILLGMQNINSKEFYIEKYVGVEKCRKALESIYLEKEIPGGYCGEFVYEDLGSEWYELHLKNMYKVNKIHDHVIFSKESLKHISYKDLIKTSWFDEKYSEYRVHPDLSLPKGLDVYITNEKVITVYTAKDPICVIIKNKTYQEYELSLFNLLWKSSIDLKSYERYKK